MTVRSAVDSSLGSVLVVSILLAMLGIVLLAGLVVLYVAYPHRGEEVPNAPWVGAAMRKGVKRLPTLDNQGESRAQDNAEQPVSVSVSDTLEHTPEHTPEHSPEREQQHP